MSDTYETDTYTRVLAYTYNLTPDADMKYEASKINKNNWVFTLAKRRRGVNILIKADADVLDQNR